MHKIKRLVVVLLMAMVMTFFVLSLPRANAQPAPAEQSFSPARQASVLSGHDAPLTPRIGIVYADLSARRLYDGFGEKDYAQLYAAVQHQAMMAGVPYDLLYETDLLTLTNIIQYDALIMPHFYYVTGTLASTIGQNLETASADYGVGMIAADLFMTFNEAGPPQWIGASRLQNLFGVTFGTYRSNVTGTLRADDVTHPVMQGYGPGDVIHTYDDGWHGYYWFTPTAGITATSLVELWDETNEITTTAVWATETSTGTRNVHFSTIHDLGNRHLLWQAIQWVVYGDELAPANLKLGRQTNLFVSRNDMDQSQFIDLQQGLGSDGVTNRLFHEFLTPWKAQYNFIGSFYLNLGYDFIVPADPNCYPGSTATRDRITYPDLTSWACTKWSTDANGPGIAPTYTLYLNDGHEIGSHSYTHIAPGLYPSSGNDMNGITPGDRYFEFADSMDIIGQNLGITLTGAAGPGNPENFDVARELAAGGYMDYFSGGYSSSSVGFPNVFGRLTPDFGVVYMAPNLSFDFSMVQVQGLTPAQAEIRWQEEYLDLNEYANQPILHWPWHDYAIAAPDSNATYSVTMFTSLLNLAHGDNAEFLTADDLQRRIRAFEGAQLALTPRPDGVTAQVVGSGFGRSALQTRPSTGQRITAVDGWYAYNDDHVFLPRDGGTFAVHYGVAPLDVTRIVTLPMRADLHSVTGNGGDIAYTFHGEGSVFLEVNVPVGLDTADAQVTGTSAYTFTGNTLEMRFETIGTHTAVVSFPVTNLTLEKQVTPTEAIPGGAITYTIFLTNNGQATAQGIQLVDTMPLSVTNITAVASGGVTINAQTGTPPNYQWQLADMPAGTAGRIQITGIVHTATTPGSTLTNNATVSTSNTEGNSLDNSAAVSTLVSTTARCQLRQGELYTFYPSAALSLTIQTDVLGDLHCIRVAAEVGNHPAVDPDAFEQAGLRADSRWWRLSALDNSGADASGTFSLTLTLPTSFEPTASDKLCRYLDPQTPGDQVWACGYSSHTVNPHSITQQNVTEFSDWIVAQNVGPTAVSMSNLQVVHEGGNTAVVTLLFLLLLTLTLWTGHRYLWRRPHKNHR